MRQKRRESEQAEVIKGIPPWSKYWPRSFFSLFRENSPFILHPVSFLMLAPKCKVWVSMNIEKEGIKLTVKERILSIQLAERIKNRVEYANRIGVEAKTVRKKSK